MKDVFVYGTLLNDEVLKILLGHIPTKRVAELHGYKRVQVIGQRYPAILRDANSKVEGALLTELSDTDLQRLDEYEAEQYERIAAFVSVAGGERRECMTYVFRPEYSSLLSSEAWSNESFRAKYLQRFLKEIKEL